jgi:hypothetical protein
MSIGMNLGGMGGYGLQGSDPNLAEKIAKLKSGRKSSKDQIAEYLQKEMGVDLRELALTERSALARVAELIDQCGADETVTLTGNSRGLKQVTWGIWEDDEAEAPEGKIATESDDQGTDWHDWARVFDALVHQAKTDGAPAYAFHVSRTWNSDSPVTVQRAATKAVNPDPMSYPPGTFLRIERRIISEDDTHNERHYVTVGTVFGDEGVTILETRQPMTDLTGWSVIEEL